MCINNKLTKTTLILSLNHYFSAVKSDLNTSTYPTSTPSNWRVKLLYYTQYSTVFLQFHTIIVKIQTNLASSTATRSKSDKISCTHSLPQINSIIPYEVITPKFYVPLITACTYQLPLPVDSRANHFSDSRPNKLISFVTLLVQVATTSPSPAPR